MRTAGDTGDEIGAEPGVFTCDVVPHRGATTEVPSALTVHLTCVTTGWAFTASVDGTPASVIAALRAAQETVPIEFVTLCIRDHDETRSRAFADWAAGHNIHLGRSDSTGLSSGTSAARTGAPPELNYAFNRQYIGVGDLEILNLLWVAINDRRNFLTPVTIPNGYRTDRNGRRIRQYDAPAIPLDRLLATGTLSLSQQRQLHARRAALDPDDITTRIADLEADLA